MCCGGAGGVVGWWVFAESTACYDCIDAVISRVYAAPDNDQGQLIRENTATAPDSIRRPPAHNH